MDAVLNLITWGVGKGIKKLKPEVGRIVEGTEIVGTSVYSLAPTQTKKKTEEDYDSEFSEVLRKDSGKITNWSTPVDENMILEYMRNPTSNKMVKNQYDLYRNKNEYIDRLNKLIPMEILMPLGGAGFVGHELNKE